MCISYYEKIGDAVTNIDDEIPFQLPVGWSWTRLSECCQKEIKRGKAPKYVPHSKCLVFAQKCNTKAGYINLSLAQYLDESTLKKYSDTDFMQFGDIVINSTGTGTLGRVGIYEEKDNACAIDIVPDSHITTVRAFKHLNSRYIYTVLKSIQDYLETCGEGSTNQKELRPDTISNILIPLPPISEQDLIVNKTLEIYAILNALAIIIN